MKMVETIIYNFRLDRIGWILKRRLLLILLFAAIGGVALGYYGFSNGVSLYVAKTSLYVYSSPSYVENTSANVTNADFTMAKNLVPSYMLVLKSDTVLSKINEKLDLGYSVEELNSMISASAIKDTAVFHINVYNRDPFIAMQVANAVAEIAPAEIARVVKSGGVEVIDYATLPVVPYSSTDVTKFSLLGVAAGAVLSAVIFLFFGLLDTTIRKKSEIEDIFNIPILGEVPMMHDLSRRIKVDKILKISSPFAVKESYNSIRMSLLGIENGQKCPTYVVTSAEQSDGKTLNCINIAISFAQLGKKVLLIDADLRKPSVNVQLNMELTEEGLSQYLSGILDEVTLLPTGTENLSLLPAGQIPENPAELISSTRFAQLLEQMKGQFDYIFIDTPPVGIVADAMLLDKYSSGYIIVVREDASKLIVEKRVVHGFEQMDIEVVCFLYNGLEPKRGEYIYKNYYGYGNLNEGSKKKKKFGKKRGQIPAAS